MLLPLALALVQFSSSDTGASMHVGDGNPLVDPMRPVTRISRNSFTLHYYTTTPCESKVQVREGNIPLVAYRGAGKPRANLFDTSWTVAFAGHPTTNHTVTVNNLKAGQRYFYRIFDPAISPTSEEQHWGAEKPWRREFAVSTQAPKGMKTIIMVPVKVLLMPNVINVASAYPKDAPAAPKPPRMTDEQIYKIRQEYAASARFFWVNSGMRLWVDYRFYIDDRWQSWGPVPEGADPSYRNWPVCRSYAGRDYADPGGGTFTIVDTADPKHVTTEPVVEEWPFSGQIEQAWTRRWNAQKRAWEFYNSGGGTLGVDQFWQGIPGRSQFLAGGDTAWLATHEFHHDLESHGAFAFSNREDERIVFNHYAPRHRVIAPDGAVDEGTWTTNGRHGEHWDGMAYWDRTISDAQWLRFYFGYTKKVKDADEDGFPDEDPRLPLDEERFGSLSTRKASDGHMGDLEKAMLSTWAPGPLQSSWIKPPFQGIKPNPRGSDSDLDGLDDGVDPEPLIPFDPFIYPLHAVVDGDPAEWQNVPIGGAMTKGGIEATFRQAHDDAAYFGLMLIKGPWKRIDAVFDGEGQGVYSGVGVQGFSINRAENAQVTVKPIFGNAPGLRFSARQLPDGYTALEFSFPNRGEGIWYWSRGGREIGHSINIFDGEGRGYSMGEPYHLSYARMLEAWGTSPIPADAPPEVEVGPGVDVLKPGDPSLRAAGGWHQDEDAFRYHGEVEGPLYVEGLSAREFDLWADVEGKSDAILGAFLPSTKTIGTGSDYIGFVGGYGNLSSRLRIFGQELGTDGSSLPPGRHRVQLSRRKGAVWLLLDGKAIVYAVDPNPTAKVDRVAIFGGYGGEQIVREIRLRQ